MKFFDRLIKIIKEKKFIAKVLSLTLSVVLWAYISSTMKGELKFKIPIEVMNLPTGMIVSKMSDNTVLVTVDGKKDFLKNIRVKNLQVTVDLKNPKIGVPKKYRLRLSKVDMPENINITLSKKTVIITVERKIEKKVKVVPRITGNVKKGSIIGMKKVVPEYIVVQGAESLIDEIEYIYTENISVENESEDIAREVDLERMENGRVYYSKSTVKVIIPIINYGDLFKVDVDITVMNPAKDLRYHLEDKTVKLYIKYQGDREIKPEFFNAHIDVHNAKVAKRGKKRVIREFPVKISLKKEMDVDIVSVIPEKVKVEIKKE